MELRELSLLLVLLTMTPSTVNGVFGQEQVFTISPHSVRVNVGEDVFLKCVIQNQQGKAQWTKDGFALGFERDVPGYPRHSYSGDASKGEHHLVIKGALLDDDGEYQCQVGPTTNTSALVASANVTVMVAPTSLNIIRSAESNVVQGTAGHNLYLQCLVNDGRPAPSIAWYRNGIMLDDSLHTERVDQMSPETKRWSVRSRLLVVPEVQDEGQQYTCRALHPTFTRSHKALVDTVTLSVLYPPEAPVITGYTPGHILKEGDLLSLTCQSTGGNPRPQLSWYRDGRLLQHPKITPSKAGSESEGTISVIGWAVAGGDDGAVYECRAQNEVSGDLPLSDDVALSVLYRPSRVQITGPSIATAGQEFVLKCVTSKANPAASINWMVHGVKVAPVSSVVSEADGGGWVTSSDLKYHLERSMKMSEIKVECQARNALSEGAVTETRVISIMKPPGHPLLRVEGMEDLVAGGRLIVFCTSEGGNPNPGITIYKDRRKLVSDVMLEGTISKARASFEVTASDNGVKVVCEVSNPALKTPLVTFTKIRLKFAPWKVSGWVRPGEVEAGRAATLVCESSSSLPQAALSWRSGPLTMQGATSTYTQGLYGGTVTRSEMKVKALIEDNGRTFHCDAQNGLGVVLSTNISLNVLHGPVWMSAPSGTIDVHEKEDLLVTALATANPPPVKYSWWHGPLELEGQVEPVAGGGGGDGQQEGRLEMRRVHRQESGEYSVTATSPRGTANASFVINVQYGPENIVTSKRVTVDEDGSASVLCTAVGNPTPNVTWVRQEDNSSSAEVLSWGIGEARLSIEDATRAHTGFYLCLASNVVSTAEPFRSAVVVTQIPEVPDEVEGEESYLRPWANLGGTGRLECSVKAAPSPTFKWTINEDRVLLNDRKYFIRVPELVDGLVEWSSVLEIKNISLRDYTTYTCIATNSRGSYAVNYTLGSPVPPDPPQYLNVTTVKGKTANLSWVPPGGGTPPAGYTLLYRPKNGGKYSKKDVSRGDVTTAKIEGLTPGTVYEFLIQSHNAQGRSNYTSSRAQIPVPGVVEEVATSSSSSSSSQPGVPLLTLFLTSLTGAALLVLNVSIVICFVKRFVLKRNTSAVSEAYGPALTPGLDPDTGRTGSINSISSQVHFQFTSQSPVAEEKRRFSSTTHSLITEISEYQKHDETPLTTIPTSYYFLSTASPLSNCRSDLINGGLNLTARKSQSSKSLINFSEFMTPGESQPDLDDDIYRRMKVRVQSPDIPDVCPKSPTLCPALSRPQSCERIVSQLEDNEDRISLLSNHSNSSYKGIQEQSCGFTSHTPKSNVHQDNTRCPTAFQKSGRLTSSCHDIRREAIAHKPCSGPSFSNICCSNKLTSQVIYHGQPHIQQQHEEEQKREHLQHLQHQNLQQQQMSQQHCLQLDRQQQSTENTPDHHRIIHQWPDHHYQERQQNLDHQNNPTNHHYHNQDQHHRHAEVSEPLDNHHQHRDPPCQHRELNENFKFPERQPLSHRELAAPCCPTSETTMFYQTLPCCHQSKFHLHQPKYQEYQQLHNEHARYQYLGHERPAAPQQIFHSLPRKMRQYHSEDPESPKLHRVTHFTRSSTPHLYHHYGPPQSLSSNPITHSQSEHSYLTPSAQVDYQFHRDSAAEHSFSYERETPVQYSRMQPSALNILDTTYDDNGYGHFETTLEL